MTLYGCHYFPSGQSTNCGAFATVYVRKGRNWYCTEHALTVAVERGQCEATAVRASADLFAGRDVPSLRCSLPAAHSRAHRVYRDGVFMLTWKEL